MTDSMSSAKDVMCRKDTRCIGASKDRKTKEKKEEPALLLRSHAIANDLLESTCKKTDEYKCAVPG